jgi:hypothetical protein
LVLHYLAGTVALERIDFALLDSFKSMFFRQPVHGAEKPWKRIGQGAVEIEHRELVSHGETPPLISSHVTASLFAVRCIPLFGTLNQPMAIFGRLIDVRWPGH